VEKPRAEAAKPSEPGPEYESTGVISSLEGRDLTLDHEGASGAGLPAGRNVFIAYADVLGRSADHAGGAGGVPVSSDGAKGWS
jgi:hypothetical protein